MNNCSTSILVRISSTNFIKNTIFTRSTPTSHRLFDKTSYNTEFLKFLSICTSDLCKKKSVLRKDMLQALSLSKLNLKAYRVR